MSNIDNLINDLPENKRKIALIIKEKYGEDNMLCGCGERIKAINTKTISLCSSCLKGACHPNWGKKRPEHSKIMKNKAKKGELKGAFEKGRKNDYINTIAWKRKVLSNKGVDHSHMTDEEIIPFYNEFKGKLATKI